MSNSEASLDLKFVEKQTNRYKRIYPKYKRYANTLEELLKKIAKKHEIDCLTSTRPKAISSFAEKVVRKGHKYSDPVNQLTDLCGGRVITQTQDEVTRFCNLVKEHFTIDWENSVGVEDRLKPTEFGYRSVHYIIQMDPDFDYQEKYNIKVPVSVYGLYAEIQVRTLLEHAWADLYHKWAYKNEFDIPAKMQREMAGISARLEAADNSFSGVQEELKNYYTSYGAYLDSEQLIKEIAKLEITLKYDPENISLLLQLGRAANALEDWDKAIFYLSPFETSKNSNLIRILGTALCKKNKHTPEKTAFLKGQELLLKAGSPPHSDSDALASLAGSWKGINDEESNKYYQKAFELDPTDAYPLGNFLESEIMKDQNLSIIGFTKPIIGDAIKRSRSCIQVDVNIPWAYYDIGKLNLILKEPYNSFSAYAKAIDLSTAPFMIETSLNSLTRLKKVQDHIPGYQWMIDLLHLGLYSKFRSESSLQELKKRANDAEKIKPACIVLVGGSSEAVREQMETYGKLLIEAFKSFSGTIISGGTNTGISKLAGDLKKVYPDQIHTIGYLPTNKEEHADMDKRRYSELRFTNGKSFSPLEATQYWMDIIASEIEPGNVKLLVINGGKISSAECKLASMLGAKVGILQGSGGAPVKLFKDSDWNETKTIMQLPADATIISSFLSPDPPEMGEDMRAPVAREIHAQYLKSRKEKLETSDPSLEPWEKLDPGLKHSNYKQADQVFDKLELMGYKVREVTGRKIIVMKFDKEEIEPIAELEHARWVVERLSEGWKPAPEKDVEKKLSPYLISWERLSNNIKKYDRDTVKNIPRYLAKVGLEVYSPNEQ